MGQSFFPYPPTFLLLTLPLAWTSLSVAYFAWVGLSAAAIVGSLRRLLAPLVLLVPIVFLSETNGQTSLFMGACVFGAAGLHRRPILAGVLLGLAACIKPQVVVLVPIVLMAAGRWRMLFSAGVTGLAVCAIATLVYGVHAWLDWLNMLPQWLRINDAWWTGRYLALPGIWKVPALVLGSGAAVFAVRRGRFEAGVFIALAAAFLGSLHAMDYDEAILAPFAIAAGLARRWWGLAYAAALLAPASAWSVLALGVLAIVDVTVGRLGADEDKGLAIIRPTEAAR